MTTPGAGKGERLWQINNSGGDMTPRATTAKPDTCKLERVDDPDIDDIWYNVVCVTHSAIFARCHELADADLICKLHNVSFYAHEADQQTIAELRKALEDARPYVGRLAGGQHVGRVLSQGEAVKLLGRIDALAAIAATEEGKS